MFILNIFSYILLQFCLQQVICPQIKSAVSVSKLSSGKNYIFLNSIKFYTYPINFSCLAGVFQILGAFFVTWVLVGLVTLSGRTMSWYSRPYLLLGLYGLPALAIALFIILRVSAVQEKTLKSSFLIERVQFEGVKLNLTLLVILTYMFGIRSNVLLLLWLSSAIIGRSLLDKLYRQKHIGTVRVLF